MLISNAIANFWHDTRRRSIHIHIFNQESVVRQIIYRQVLNRFRNCSFSFKLLGRITNFRTILVGAQFMFIFMWKTAVLNFNLKSPHWFQGSSLHIVQNWLQIYACPNLFFVTNYCIVISGSILSRWRSLSFSCFSKTFWHTFWLNVQVMWCLAQFEWKKDFFYVLMAVCTGPWTVRLIKHA